MKGALSWSMTEPETRKAWARIDVGMGTPKRALGMARVPGLDEENVEKARAGMDELRLAW